MTTAADTNVRIGADLGALQQGMATAEQICNAASSQIVEAINAMSAHTRAAIAAMQQTMSGNFNALSENMSQTGAAAQQTGREITEAIGQASRPIPDNTRQLRQGARDTSRAMGELHSMIGQLMSMAAIVAIVKSSVDAYQRAESALYGLASAAKYTGNSFDLVMAAAQSLKEDGLMSLTEASKGLQNLLGRGFSLEESIDLMNRFRDSAAFNRQAALGFGEAVVTATEGLKNENSILVDNAGVTKNVSVMWKEYANQIGTTADKLTIGQKRQAEYNGILKETEGQLGNAAKMAKTFSGELAKSKQEAEQAKAEFAQAMIPTLSALLRAMRPIVDMAKAFVGGFQMMTVSIAGFVDKAKAIYDAGGIVGLIFSADARAKVKQQFAIIDQAVEEQKAEIFKTMNSPVAFNPEMAMKGTGPTRKDPEPPKEKEKKEKKPESRVDEWKGELDQKKLAEDAFLASSLSSELVFWETKKKNIHMSAEESRTVDREILTLKKDIQKEALQTDLEAIKLRMEGEKRGSQERADIWDEGIKKIGIAYGLDSKEYKAALIEKEKLARDHARLLADLAESVTDTNRDLVRISIEIEADAAAHAVAIGAMSAEDEVQITRDLVTRKAAIEIDALNEKLGREKIGTLEYQKLTGQIEVVQAKHVQRMNAINQKASVDQVKMFGTAFNGVQAAFSSSIQGMINGTMKLSTALKKISSTILSNFIGMGVKMVADWLKKQIMMTTINTVQEAARTATKATGEASRSGLAIAGATTQVTANAVSAASGAASALAPVPIIGPALGAAAAIAMLALVLGLGASMGSAAGGWDQVPSDQVAQIHKDEMVLPAELADGVRANLGSGANKNQAGGGQILINAVDARGVKRLLSDNGGALTSALTKQARNFAGGKVTRRG